jgi:putative tricarboxylic transport membrane protein
MFLQGKYLMPLFVKLTNVLRDLLVAVLMMTCCTGAFAIANMNFDMYVMLISGVAAYFLRKLDFPTAPIVLGSILGPIAESNLRNSLVLSSGSWFIFIKRPICFVFIAITIILIILLKKNEAKQQRIMRELQTKNG